MARNDRFLILEKPDQSFCDHLLEQSGLAPEVVGNGAGTDTRLLRHMSQGRPHVAVAAEGQDGAVENLIPAFIRPTLPLGTALKLLDLVRRQAISP